MRLRRLALLLVFATLCALALAGSAASAPPPAPPLPSCSPAPASCFEWHRSPVTVTWSAPPAGVSATGCGTVTISEDTGGTPVSCTWSNLDGSATTTVNVRKDSTPPAVIPSPDRGPDNNGWYNRAVRVEFSGDDGASGVASCTSGAYSGPDSENAAVSGSCTDNAGNTGATSFGLKFDGTPPSVEAKPERKPNEQGWYNRAVRVEFVGSDALSGVDSCAQPVVYTGPDTPGTSLSGTCRDKAANTSAPASLEVKYDTKPPALTRVRAIVARKGIALSWAASEDAFSFSVVRAPGRSGRKPTTLYSGPARRFTDTRLTGGITYRYTVTAYDRAGNGAARGLQARAAQTTAAPTRAKPKGAKPARATPGLRQPVAGARLTSPPTLRWTAVPNATYYNVQLYRGGRKILTAWPTTPSFRLERTWRFGGRTYALTPGTYRWYVWPGLGPRSANRYGKLVGTRRFAVIRT